MWGSLEECQVDQGVGASKLTQSSERIASVLNRRHLFSACFRKLNPLHLQF